MGKGARRAASIPCRAEDADRDCLADVEMTAPRIARTTWKSQRESTTERARPAGPYSTRVLPFPENLALWDCWTMPDQNLMTTQEHAEITVTQLLSGTREVTVIGHLPPLGEDWGSDWRTTDRLPPLFFRA